jgi:uncharacterized membrane protein YeaQ/YmgE (transglycosylase-associated protein family)
MTLLDFLLLLVIAGLCGAVAQALVGFSRGGCLLSIVLGFIGSLLGHWLARVTGLPDWLALNIDGVSFPVVWSVIGAALFVAVISLLTRGRAP